MRQQHAVASVNNLTHSLENAKLLFNHVFSNLRLPEVIVLRTFPRIVREFVLVLWPRTGSFLR